MARTWWSVTVELLGGRGTELWPWPGRVFAVGPSHTFADLADAVNAAFARWDRAHLSMFTLADGQLVTDRGTGSELTNAMAGPIPATLDIDAAKVARTLEPGSEFRFVFDLGDDWTHRCLVATQKIDPLDILGVHPDAPVPYWGWGDIPDQYGRRWADDDGQSRTPPRPRQPHPMLTGGWPGEAAAVLDLSEVRAAIATEDADRFLAAVTGCDIDDGLQQLGAGVSMALAQRRERAEPVAASVITRLTGRAGAGDQVLADDLLAILRRGPMPGRMLPVDLDELGDELEGDPERSTGGYLDLRTGAVLPDFLFDAVEVGDDDAIDMEEEPDRWLKLDRFGSRDGWRDMAAFAARQRDQALRDRLERAIEGKGAFRRFRDLVYEEGLVDSWHAFAAERKQGRARDYLADQGIRVGRPLSALP